MTKSPKKQIYIYTAMTWILTILAFLFRLLSRLYSYDSDIGYFQDNEPFPILYRTALILIVLLAASAFFTFRNTKLPESVLSGMKHTCVMEKTAAIAGGALMLTASVSTVLYYWIHGTLISEGLPNGFTVFGLVTACISCFFFLFFWIPSKYGKTLHLLCGFAFILHFIYILGASYFELYTPMNNPVKMLVQLSVISAIFYLLTDLRFYMDNARPARYIFSSTVFLGFGAVSTLSGGFFSVPTEEYTMLYHLYNLVIFALLILAAVRVTRMLSLWAQSDGDDESDDEDPDETQDNEAVGEEISFPSEEEEHPSDEDPLDSEAKQDTEQ